MHCEACGNDNPVGARFCNACGASLAEMPANESGPASVGGGRYVIKELLGEGARKRVYAGLDGRLGRDVAVAVVKTDGLDHAGHERIAQEARAMARLGDHPNIVTVFDVGEDDDQPYIVSQLMSARQGRDDDPRRNHMTPT
jgi:eukaryotic-like serine/threonine-protein kinase